jgi:type I restriction enzyme M protein
MNFAIRGIDTQMTQGDIFHNDRYPELKADHMLTNLPFNDSSWCVEMLEDGARWVYGVPEGDFVRRRSAAQNNGEVLHG